MPGDDVVVIGAGLAGLAVSHELSGRGVEHVVLERGRVAETWRGRWDSFCLRRGGGAPRAVRRGCTGARGRGGQYLACGRAPWAPRRFGGRDLLWWAHETGFLDVTVDKLPSPEARLAANIQASGHGGGHDLHYRTLRALGVTLLGHFLGASGRGARFADDLTGTVAWGDARRSDLNGLVERTCDARGSARPELPDPEPFTADGAPLELDLTRSAR